MKWILDKSVDPKNMLLTAAEIPERKYILEYFKEHSEPKACATSYIFDNIANKRTNLPVVLYNDGFFEWSSTLVYKYEKYNIKLSDEFINHVMEQVEENNK